MRSEHVDEFNHDPWAEGYDADVRNENNPIRTGYEALLTWVAGQVSEREDLKIVDLGAGTGNLTVKLPTGTSIVAVDTSSRMFDIARQKLGERSVKFIKADILAFVAEDLEPVDAIVSTYAFHHLTEDEKKIALTQMANMLNPGGRIIIGDLMFETGVARAAALEGYQSSGQKELARDIEEEFFWTLDTDKKVLVDAGLKVEIKQFSALSWGLCATRS